MKKTALGAFAIAGTMGLAHAQTNPAVVVTIENTAPYNGGFLTPVWVGFHNGQFDTYNGGTPANLLPIQGSDAIERLAEDGNTGPITRDFDILQGPEGTQGTNGVQGTIRSNGPVPPIGPGQIVSQLFEVAPTQGEATYFTYASMIVPSNDAFSSNGNPRAHLVYNAAGDFAGESFYVLGSDVDDAGTEFNDELPQNTAFFGQVAPDTGAPGEGLISGAGNHPGLNEPIPGVNILGTPRFGDSDFNQSNYDVARIKLTFIDKAAPILFNGDLDSTFSIPGSDSDATGKSFFFLDDDGESLIYFVFTNDLSGDITAAHLHLAPKLQTGPVTLPLRPLFGRFAFGRISAEAVVGPLAGEDAIDNVIAEMVSGSTYVNIHTAANPAGEIRGQVHVNAFQ